MHLIRRIFPYQPPKAEGFTFKNPYPQKFPFPSDMMKHITFNPSNSKAWNKLIKTCKYFCSNNQVFVLDRAVHCDGQVCMYYAKDFLLIPVEKVPFKIWLTGKLLLAARQIGISVYNAPNFIFKVFRSDLTALSLHNQRILFDEIKLLIDSKKLKDVRLDESAVIKNRRVISMEEIVENLSSITSFHFSLCPDNHISITNTTIPNLIKILPTTNIKKMQLENLNGSFDFDAIFDFMMNQHKISFHLKFARDLPADYNNRLREAVNRILASEKVPFPKHGIYYGEDESTNVLQPLYNSIYRRCKYLYKQYKYEK